MNGSEKGMREKCETGCSDDNNSSNDNNNNNTIFNRTR